MGGVPCQFAALFLCGIVEFLFVRRHRWCGLRQSLWAGTEHKKRRTADNEVAPPNCEHCRSSPESRFLFRRVCGDFEQASIHSVGKYLILRKSLALRCTMGILSLVSGNTMTNQIAPKYSFDTSSAC